MGTKENQTEYSQPTPLIEKINALHERRGLTAAAVRGRTAPGMRWMNGTIELRLERSMALWASCLPTYSTSRLR
jgi:hypothetical protein